MEAGATIVAFHRKRGRNVLHRKVISNCTRAITNEIECWRKTAAREKVMKKVVQRSLL